MTDCEMKMANEDTEKKLEFRLVDVLQLVRNNLMTFALFLLLGVVGGITVYGYLPPKWQADVTLQIGKIPIMQNLVYISAPVEVVEKIKSPLFLSKMLSAMYGNEVNDDDDQISSLLYKDLKVSMIKGSDLITVRVFGRNAAEAYKNAGILADSLIAEHQALSARHMALVKNRLTEVGADIARSREVLTRVDLIERALPSKHEANALLKIALIDAKTTEIQRLKTEQSKLEELLSAANLQTTRVVGRTLMPKSPTSPSLPLTIAGGAMLGLLLGLLWSLSALIHQRGWHRFFH